MTWTQPVCYDRFKSMYPDREPPRVLGIPEGEQDGCCFCLKKTTIYVRIDPTTVPHPVERRKN